MGYPIDPDKENYGFLGKTKVQLKGRYVGKITKLCMESNFQPKLNRIKLFKTDHKRKYYRFADPKLAKIFQKLLGNKSELITQDKINVLKLMGLRFFVVRKEHEI